MANNILLKTKSLWIPAFHAYGIVPSAGEGTVQL
jgi:hypothetical protein